MAIGVNVTYTLKTGQREAFCQEIAAAGLRQAVLNEDGCIQYDYFLPLDSGDQLLLVEKWTSREAQQIHLTQPHMQRFQQIKARCVVDTGVEFYTL